MSFGSGSPGVVPLLAGKVCQVVITRTFTPRARARLRASLIGVHSGSLGSSSWYMP